MKRWQRSTAFASAAAVRRLRIISRASRDYAASNAVFDPELVNKLLVLEPPRLVFEA